MPDHLVVDMNTAQPLVVDTTRIREELAYSEAVSQGEGLRRTVDWERAHPPEKVDLRAIDYAAEDAVLAEVDGHRG
jgi:hypothetical protein